jgi:hypothetical protein
MKRAVCGVASRLTFSGESARISARGYRLAGASYRPKALDQIPNLAQRRFYRPGACRASSRNAGVREIVAVPRFQAKQALFA